MGVLFENTLRPEKRKPGKRDASELPGGAFWSISEAPGPVHCRKMLKKAMLKKN